jgi:hypothetical protein
MSRYEVVPKLIGTIEKQRGGGVVAERQNAFIRDHEYTASASLINIALLSGNLVNEFVDALGLRLCRLQIIDHWLKKLSSLRNRRFLLFFQILYFRIYRIGTVEGIEINWRALFPEESGRHDNVRVGSAFIEKAKSYQKCFAGVLNSATKEHYIRDGLLLHYFSQGGQDRGLIRSVRFQSFVNAEGFKKYDQCKKGKENACDGRDGQDCASTLLQRKLLFVALSLGTLLNLCVGIYMLNKGTDLFGQVPKWQVDMLTYGGGVIIYSCRPFLVRALVCCLPLGIRCFLVIPTFSGSTLMIALIASSNVKGCRLTGFAFGIRMLQIDGHGYSFGRLLMDRGAYYGG